MSNTRDKGKGRRSDTRQSAAGHETTDNDVAPRHSRPDSRSNRSFRYRRNSRTRRIRVDEHQSDKITLAERDDVWPSNIEIQDTRSYGSRYTGDESVNNWPPKSHRVSRFEGYPQSEKGWRERVEVESPYPPDSHRPHLPRWRYDRRDGDENDTTSRWSFTSRNEDFTRSTFNKETPRGRNDRFGEWSTEEWQDHRGYWPDDTRTVNRRERPWISREEVSENSYRDRTWQPASTWRSPGDRTPTRSKISWKDDQHHIVNTDREGHNSEDKRVQIRGRRRILSRTPSPTLSQGSNSYKSPPRSVSRTTSPKRRKVDSTRWDFQQPTRRFANSKGNYPTHPSPSFNLDVNVRSYKRAPSPNTSLSRSPSPISQASAPHRLPLTTYARDVTDTRYRISPDSIGAESHPFTPFTGNARRRDRRNGKSHRADRNDTTSIDTRSEDTQVRTYSEKQPYIEDMNIPPLSSRTIGRIKQRKGDEKAMSVGGLPKSKDSPVEHQRLASRSNRYVLPASHSPGLSAHSPPSNGHLDLESLTSEAEEESRVRYQPSSELPEEIFQIVSQVGEGTFGKVYKAKNRITGLFVALKKIRMEGERDGFPVTAMREIKLLQSLQHDNVICLHEMMVSEGHAHMVFEYMDHDLTGILAQTQIEFKEEHLKSFCRQMLSGLAYLHQRGVIHRDMKGSNILVNRKGELKLADFGLARFYQKRRKSDYTNRVITLWYRPPELLLGASVYGPEVDMWSAGCIMLELFTKKPVFQGSDEINQLDVLFKILGTPSNKDWPGLSNLPWFELMKPSQTLKNRFKDLFKRWLTPAALELAQLLLLYNPEKRISASAALEVSYFTSEQPAEERPISLAQLRGEWHEFEHKQAKRKRIEERHTEE